MDNIRFFPMVELILTWKMLKGLSEAHDDEWFIFAALHAIHHHVALYRFGMVFLRKY